MGREIKRVPLDFDWPIGKIWPPYMGGICSEEVKYCVGEDKSSEEVCDACRHAARLTGKEIKKHGCPDWKVHPPSGEGWQMWETVTEGSPMSPVCKSPEELARWLADNKASACGYEGATYDEWLNTIKAGWAPSMVLTPEKGLMSGVKASADGEGVVYA